jgi:hypothetical protein
MRLIQLTSACALLWGLGSSEVIAQRSPGALHERSLGASTLVLSPVLPNFGGTREGAIWSGIGAVTGVLASVPVFALLGMTCFADAPDPANPMCYPPLAALGVGAGVGASLGSETGGNRPAWLTTLIGAAGGVVVGTIAARPFETGEVSRDRSKVGAYTLLLVPPALGAWLGNRLGQPALRG